MRLLISFAKNATHPHPHHPPNVDKRHINVSVPKTNFWSSLTFTFLYLIEFRNAAWFLRIFVLYIHAPPFIPPTMHIVNSINSLCLHFIRSDSFIQWNQTNKQTDQAALSILTHSVPLVSWLQLFLIETIYSIISMPSVQPFKSVLHFLFHFSGTTKTNSFINSINAIRDPTHPPRAFGTPLSER